MDTLLNWLGSLVLFLGASVFLPCPPTFPLHSPLAKQVDVYRTVTSSDEKSNKRHLPIKQKEEEDKEGMDERKRDGVSAKKAESLNKYLTKCDILHFYVSMSSFVF